MQDTLNGRVRDRSAGAGGHARSLNATVPRGIVRCCPEDRPWGAPRGRLQGAGCLRVVVLMLTDPRVPLLRTRRNERILHVSGLSMVGG